MPDKTTLWNVYLFLEEEAPVVLVSDAPQDIANLVHHQQIRSISPTAAARKYIRNTLPGRMAIAKYRLDQDHDNPSDYLTPRVIRREQKQTRETRIRVVKSSRAR